MHLNLRPFGIDMHGIVHSSIHTFTWVCCMQKRASHGLQALVRLWLCTIMFIDLALNLMQLPLLILEGACL